MNDECVARDGDDLTFVDIGVQQLDNHVNHLK